MTTPANKNYFLTISFIILIVPCYIMELDKEVKRDYITVVIAFIVGFLGLFVGLLINNAFFIAGGFTLFTLCILVVVQLEGYKVRRHIITDEKPKSL